MLEGGELQAGEGPEGTVSWVCSETNKRAL